MFHSRSCLDYFFIVLCLLLLQISISFLILYPPLDVNYFSFFVSLFILSLLDCYVSSPCLACQFYFRILSFCLVSQLYFHNLSPCLIVSFLSVIAVFIASFLVYCFIFLFFLSRLNFMFVFCLLSVFCLVNLSSLPTHTHLFPTTFLLAFWFLLLKRRLKVSLEYIHLVNLIYLCYYQSH